MPTLYRRPCRGASAASTAFTLIELLVVIGVLALLIALLLPFLSRARRSAVMSKMASEGAAQVAMPAALAPAGGDANAPASQPAALLRPAAAVRSFDADVTLSPRLSVGTAEPESIYEARFSAKLEATAPPPPTTDARPAGPAGSPAEADCEIHLPLPPQVISLADLTVTVDGRPSDAAEMRGDKLVWHGPLPAGPSVAPALVNVTYTAVGKGLYTLQTPPGRVLDRFKIRLAANGSDVRMLELSMQPTGLERAGGQTVYTWDYRRLMFGRPVAVDVLGIAPVDRLGELSWLGPVGVVVFGVAVGFVARASKAFQAGRFDRWMLLLVLGTFTAAYPLMYFAQEFVPLPWAVAAAAGVVLVVIGWRAVSIMGWRVGVAGVVIPADVVLAVTLAAAVRPNLQGVLLTGLALGLFVLAMALAPRLRPVGVGPAVATVAPAAA